MFEVGAHIDTKKLIDDFAHGIEERHYMSVLLVSKSFVVFRMKGHTAWSGVGSRSYVRGKHILIRRGEWWMHLGGTNREWEGRVGKKTLVEALRQSELTGEVYELTI